MRSSALLAVPMAALVFAQSSSVEESSAGVDTSYVSFPPYSPLNPILSFTFSFCLESVSSHTYHSLHQTNPFTSFTTETNALGVVTGMPTIVTTQPTPVTTQPDPVLTNTAVAETVPAGPPAEANSTSMETSMVGAPETSMVGGAGSAAPSGGAIVPGSSSGGNGTTGGNNTVPAGTRTQTSGESTATSGSEDSTPTGDETSTSGGAATTDGAEAGSGASGLLQPILGLGFAGVLFAAFL
ncbi:MAG: hypothetical protein Q9198_010950 [Flavoplaca austrocitrina]